MPASLRTVKPTVQPDGVAKWLQSLELDAPADAVVTVLIPSREPNAETVKAMLEPAENLPRFASAAQLLNILNS